MWKLAARGLPSHQITAMAEQTAMWFTHPLWGAVLAIA